MTPATAADRAEIEAFLDRDLTRAMFPRANLDSYGMAGGHRLSMRFWVSRAAGRIDGVLGTTEEGMILPVLPNGAEGVAEALAGRPAIGVIGPPDQVQAILDATGLEPAPRVLDRVEPHFLLDLADLRVPEGPGLLAPFEELGEETALAWLCDYNFATLGLPPEEARQRAARTLATVRGTGSHAILIDGIRPLSMTGCNAALPSIVQVGGVYTPPAYRSRGHARRAVALHLALARDGGVGQATLFASGPPAVRAYEAIGFRRIGDWRLALFPAPQVAGGGA